MATHARQESQKVPGTTSEEDAKNSGLEFSAGSEDAPKHPVMAGDSEMASLMRLHDWSQTPLGPVAGWPQSLKTVVRILVASRYAMWLGWGPDLTFLYNDAYAKMTLGKKHPWALGKPSRLVWAEIWPELRPRIQRVLEAGEATWDEALQLFLERSGYTEETYHTFSYIPVNGDDGGIHGNLCVVTEETERVIGERRLASLRTLAIELGSAITEKDVRVAIARSLEKNQLDLPFTLTYLFEDGKDQAWLACTTGITPGHVAAPELINLKEGTAAAWPLRELVQCKVPVIEENLDKKFGWLPTGAWDKPPQRALLVPITRAGQEGYAGVFVAALNRYRQIDANYEGFINLVAGQIAAAVANARAYDEERKRAEALAQLDRAKTTFFSNVSHELRTPLTLMLGPVENMLARENRAQQDRRDLELLHRNSLRLLRLVNALLDFSRIEAGRVQARFVPVDFSRFTRDLASVFQSTVERAGLRFSVDCSPLDEPVYVDREMWEKIVLNLISNAFKSTFEGEISVAIRRMSGKAELIVRDTGTGIPESELPYIFERFRRVEGARRRTHEGSGIGLALVHELVSMHGGSIAVDSGPGQGTTFTVALPFGSAHLLPDQIANSPENADLNLDTATAFVQEALSWFPDEVADETPLPVSSRSPLAEIRKQSSALGRVLLADDNHDMRDYLARLLSQKFEVTTAQNGKQAYELALAYPPDLVLTDVMMPEVDGFRLLASLRAHPSTKTVPVIMLSARAGEESRMEGLEAGADHYVVKPFTARELLATVESHVRLARFRTEAGRVEALLKEELQRTKLQAAHAIENISDGFVMMDAGWRLTYMNASAESATGINRDLLIGKSVWELAPGLRGTEVERQLQQVINSRHPAEFEFFYEFHRRWYLLRVHPAPESGLVIYIRDIETKKKAQQALQRAEQLATAGRLAASIAHEINNPLEAVTNLLFLAKADSSAGSSTRKLLEVADKELQRLSHIARGSLKFYRQSTAPAEASLVDLLETVLFLYEPRIQRSNVHLQKRFSPTPALHCFAGEVQQVFANIIGNALDAVGLGDHLAISIRPGSDWRDLNRHGIRVTIADTGHGIAPEDRGRLFEPFFTTKSDTGTGLGLWVTSEILKKHSAAVRVRSRSGTGTVFSLFFPLDGLREERGAA